MKISVDLAQAVSEALQSPPPRHAQVFDPLEHGGIKEWMHWVGVGDAHDALAMAHQLADAPYVQPCVYAPYLVNRHQVVAERIGPDEVEFRKRIAVPQA